MVKQTINFPTQGKSSYTAFGSTVKLLSLIRVQMNLLLMKADSFTTFLCGNFSQKCFSKNFKIYYADRGEVYGFPRHRHKCGPKLRKSHIM